jgi:hypothetical protein
MWSLTSQRERRTSGPENFQSSAKKDFFNTIRQERSFHNRLRRFDRAAERERRRDWERRLENARTFKRD